MYLANRQTETDNKLDIISSGIIQALLYFDIFQYPLKAHEIKTYIPEKNVSGEDIKQHLQILLAKGYIKKTGDYYFINHDGFIDRRVKGNMMAEKMMEKANRYSAIISKFPFVRCVCISGSLSKGFIDEQGDIDYFIITEPGRLWICRSLLIIFKKLFLLNSHRYFCVNYFIDTNHLEIPDKNIFTATELLSLIPMYNTGLFCKLIETNNWALYLLPNQNIETTKEIPSKPSGIKSFLEKLFGILPSNRIDSFLMKMTLRKWRKKFPHLNEIDFERSMRTRKYVSKHHPQNFQKKVLNTLTEKRKDFETLNNIQLQNG